MFGIPAGISVLFSPETRRRLALCVVGSVVAAGLEIIGVVAVVPLMQLLTGAPTDSGVLGRLSDLFGNPPDDRLAVIIAAGRLRSLRAQGAVHPCVPLVDGRLPVDAGGRDRRRPCSVATSPPPTGCTCSATAKCSPGR